MKTDVNAWTLGMLQFGSLLRVMGEPEIAKNYETLALELRNDASEQAVEDAREWVRATLHGGSGGLRDLYVQKNDGSLDVVLQGQYQGLLQDMTAFSSGSEAPTPTLHKQALHNLFANGYTYFRQVEAPVRKGLFRISGSVIYEVMTAPGVTSLVQAKYLGGTVGYDPRGSRRDLQECQSQAHKLIAEGRHDEWVHFSSSQIFHADLLRDAEEL